MNPSRFVLQFGNDLQTSVGVMEIRIPTPDDSFISTKPEVVRAEVPFLVSIYFLDSEGLLADNVRNVVEYPCRDCVKPVPSKKGHMYLT